MKPSTCINQFNIDIFQPNLEFYYHFSNDAMKKVMLVPEIWVFRLLLITTVYYNNGFY